MEEPNIQRLPRLSCRIGRSIRKRPWLTGLIGLPLAMFVAAWLMRGHIYVAAGEFLDVGEPLASPVDDVLILGGDLQTRPFVAAEVYLSGHAERVLVVTVKHDTSSRIESLPNDTAITAAILKFRGVPETAIKILDSQKVDSTRDEARVLKKYLSRYPDRSVAVVTNNYHTRRARMTFIRIIGADSKRLKFVSAPTDGYSPEDWYYYRQGWATYLLEYLKLSYHWLTLPSE